MVRGLVGISVFFAVTAQAQPKSSVPLLVGVTEVIKVTPSIGFIDDPVAFDDQRIAYVNADAGAKSDLHIVTVATQQDTAIDLAPVTLHPIALRLLGPRAFVVGATEDGNQIAALIELGGQSKVKPGAVVYKLGPASQIVVITRDGKPRVAVHRATTTKDGTSHYVELDAIESGKRIGAGHLELDAGNANKQLEFHVNHWADGMTRAIGLAGGAWDKKENQRTPDVEATFDLVTGKMIDRRAIADLFEQRKRYQALADAGNQLDFVRMAWDNSSVQIWRNGTPKSVALDQPITSYDPKSLQGMVDADGSAWFTIKVDPVNADAVARKKADPEYLDVFHASADGNATRKARILATGMRHRFGVVGGDRFWLLERSNSFDRGGKSLTVYRFE